MTLEEKVSNIWKELEDFEPVQMWSSKDAEFDFNRLCIEEYCEKTNKIDILIAIDSTKKLVQDNYALAVTSSSAYLREGARILGDSNDL